MYDELPADIRPGHPFHMYDEIHLQPQAVSESLRLAIRHGSPIVAALERARRVIVTGCGTSFHAALGAAWLLRSFTRGRVDARAIEAFELVQYGADMRPDDVLIAISHSGTSTMPIRAMQRAREVGAETVLITGLPESEARNVAHYVLPTGYPGEKSWAHTISYTAALASAAAIANVLADSSEKLDLSPLTDVVADALRSEDTAHRMAASVLLSEQENGPARLVFVGGGAHHATAREATLKFLETSYIFTTAWELEESLHGPLAAVTPETAVVLIVPAGSSSDRAVELSRALAEIGCTPFAIVGESNAARFDHAHRLVLADVPEILAPISTVVPLQLFSYFVAVGKGQNPDLIHRGDERYLKAAGQYT